MKLNDYQRMALKTAIYKSELPGYLYPALGLCGEAGEVAEKIKRLIRDGDGTLNQDQKHQIVAELGDVLWYISALSAELGHTLNQVAELNLVKLARRQKQNQLKGVGDERERNL